MSQTDAGIMSDIRSWMETEFENENTVDAYMATARKFDRHHGLENLDTREATTFVTETMDDLANSSRERHREALKSVERAARAYDVIDAEVDWDVVPSPTAEDREKRALPPDDIQRILAAADDFGVMASAVTHLGYDLGMRVSEVADLSRGDIDLEAGEVEVDRKKGGPTHTLPINDKTRDRVELYLQTDYYEEYESQREGPSVFPSPDKINRDFRQVGQYAGFELEDGERWGFHILRHSRATNLLRPEPYGSGWDIQSVKEFLGHSEIETTQEYLGYIDDDNTEQDMEDFVAKMKRDIDEGDGGLV